MKPIIAATIGFVMPLATWALMVLNNAQINGFTFIEELTPFNVSFAFLMSVGLGLVFGIFAQWLCDLGERS